MNSDCVLMCVVYVQIFLGVEVFNKFLSMCFSYFYLVFVSNVVVCLCCVVFDGVCCEV